MISLSNQKHFELISARSKSRQLCLEPLGFRNDFLCCGCEEFTELSVVIEALLLSPRLRGTSSMFVPAHVCVCVWDCLGWDNVWSFVCAAVSPQMEKFWRSLPHPPPLLSITKTHTGTHTLGVGMICRFRCCATLLPILASFRHRQCFLPFSSTLGRGAEEWGGSTKGGYRGDFRSILSE